MSKRRPHQPENQPLRVRSLLRALLLAFGLLVVALFFLIGILSVTRDTPVNSVRTLDGGRLPSLTDSLFMRTMQMYTGLGLHDGNIVEPLENGNGTYPIFWSDLRGARRTITAQFYFSQPGEVADTLAAILMERRRVGVRVLLLLDAFGSRPLKGDWVERLRAAGVEVAWLRPLHWYTLHKADERSHVRAIIVDGKVGYTGGFGLADYWLGDGRHEEQWREANVRVQGPAVARLQAAFAEGWAEATGQLLVGDDFFSPSAFEPVGAVRAGVLHTAPTVGSTSAERFLALTIVGSRRQLYITNAYFVPGEEFNRLLVEAAGRGVDVRVLVAGPRTDVKTTYYASRYRYEQLLKGGVRIFEYQPTNLHAKTIVADGVWSAIGSMNFDNRSLAFNNELMLASLDRVVGAQMDSIFFADLAFTREIRLVEFRRRVWRERLLEWGANLIWRVL